MNFLFQIVLLISSLPLKILYAFSDVIFVIAYYIVGYRKDVVSANIKNSFPKRNAGELKQIEKKFYRNFSDYIIETVKAFTISDKELRIRVQHLNRKIFDDAKSEGKNVILLAGHVFNWEWFNALTVMIPQEKCFPVYRKVNSDFWESRVKMVRNRFGNEALEANDVIRHILRNPNDGNSTYMFIADQTPHATAISLGINFLNQDTPVFTGYDKLATRMDLIFVYCEMKKVKRGFYQVNYQRILPDDKQFVQFEVVKKFHRLLENTIRKRPDNYLWSHRKWKYADAIKTMTDII